MKEPLDSFDQAVTAVCILTSGAAAVAVLYTILHMLGLL